MNIPDIKWQQSEIQHHLKNFSGVIGQFFKQTTTIQIQRMEKFLPFIFWRWFHLSPDGSIPSPYQNLNLISKLEGWPKNGQFLCIPQVEMKEENKLNVCLTVDFISFGQQPILVDLLNMQSKKPLKYTFGSDYFKDLIKLSEILEDQAIDICDKNNLTTISEIYLTQILLTWYKKDNFIHTGFSQKEWLNFWQDILRRITQTHYFDTQFILDPFIDIMRQAIPDYGLKNNQLDNKFADKTQLLSTFIFWVNLNRFLIIPLSLYSGLLAPNFVEPENFYEDIKDFLESDYKDATSLFCPATFISATDFGKMVFTKL